MQIFSPDPCALISARLVAQAQGVAPPRLEVVVIPGRERNAIAPMGHAGPASSSWRLDQVGQPAFRTLAPGILLNGPTGPSLLEPHIVQAVGEHISRSLETVTPLQAGFRQLSLLPGTQLGSAAGLSPGESAAFTIVDWLIYSLGLAIGIVALPTIYPAVRFVRGYQAVNRLADGLNDLTLASRIVQTAKTIPQMTETTAQDTLQVFRGQACRPRLLTVAHKSTWSAVAETALLDYLDTRVPGFSLQVLAKDSRDGRRGELLKATGNALYLSYLLKDSVQQNIGDQLKLSPGSGLNFDQVTSLFLAAKAYI